MQRRPHTIDARASSARGHTLVEMVVVITVLGIIALVPSVVIVESMRIHNRVAPTLEASYQARLATEKMKRELRELDDTSKIGLMSATSLAFVDGEGDTITYALTGTDLTRNDDLLAQGVTDLNFAFVQQDGKVVSTSADLALIEIDLTVQVGVQEYRVLTMVHPRGVVVMGDA